MARDASPLDSGIGSSSGSSSSSTSDNDDSDTDADTESVARGRRRARERMQDIAGSSDSSGGSTDSGGSDNDSSSSSSSTSSGTPDMPARGGDPSDPSSGSNFTGGSDARSDSGSSQDSNSGSSSTPARGGDPSDPSSGSKFTDDGSDSSGSGSSGGSGGSGLESGDSGNGGGSGGLDYSERVPTEEEMTTGPTAPPENDSRETTENSGTPTLPARGGDPSDPSSGSKFTGSDQDTGRDSDTESGNNGTQEPVPEDLEFEENTVDRTEGPGTSIADIGLANQLEDQLSEEYGDRDFEFATVGDDAVVRFETDAGRTRYVPVALSEDSDQATQAARSLQREEQRETIADDLGVDGSDLGLTEDGRVEFQSEDARRQALREQYGEDAEISRLGEGAFRVTVPGEGRPQSGAAVDRASATDGETVIVPFGEEGEQTLETLQAYDDTRNALAGQNRAADAAAAAENREEGQAVLDRGNLGDPREIRREDAAEQVSRELGIPVDEDDVTIADSPGGEQRLELSGQAQRAALLSSSSQFLNRDADVEKTADGEYRVTLPGDSDAMEEALTQKIRTGEAFGGETTISAFGQTLNLDQATEDFAGFVEGAASTAGDAADRANLFSGKPPGVDGDPSQNLVGASSTAEAGENFVIQTLEGGAAAVGDVPRGLLELGEAATDPTAYRVGAEASMMGLRRVDDISASSAQSAGAGFIGTAERADELARENPEAAASVGAGVLGGAAVTAASFAAAPAALSRVASASPRGARAIAATLDPVRTTARLGARAASTAASRGASGARTAARSARQAGPDVSLVEDPDAGLVDVTPEARQEIRSGLSSRTPSRGGLRSGLAERIGATRQRARTELANAELRRREVADAVGDASPRDLIEGGRALGQRVRDEASGAARGAAFSAESAVFNARRAARDVEASDVVPSRLTGRGDSGSEPLLGRVEGRAKGAAIDAGLAARRVRETSVSDLAPPRPSLPSRSSSSGSDAELGRVEGAIASLNVNTRLAARRARDLDAGDLLPSRPSRPSLGDGDSFVGPVRGRVAGAAASGEAALRQLRNTDPGDVLPSRPSTPNVRDFTLRVEPSRPPRTPMTRTLDVEDADLTDAEANVFDTFDSGATGDADGGSAGQIGQNVLGGRTDLGTGGQRQAASSTPVARQLTRSRQRDAPASLTRDTFEAGPMVGSALIGGTTSSFDAISSQATRAEVASAVQDQPLLQQQDNIGLATFGPEQTQTPNVTDRPEVSLLNTPSITETQTPTRTQTPFQPPSTTTETPPIQIGTPAQPDTSTPPTTRGGPDFPDFGGDADDDRFGFGVNTAELDYQLGANIFGGL